MSELSSLLSLYQENPNKFTKLIKKNTGKNISGRDVISLAKQTLESYEAEIASGALRPVKTTGDLLSVVKLGRHLIGREVYRIWNGGKNGKICSAVEIKGIKVSQDLVTVTTQSKYSSNSNAINPVVRELDILDLNVTWFLSESDCKKAIERM